MVVVVDRSLCSFDPDPIKLEEAGLGFTALAYFQPKDPKLLREECATPRCVGLIHKPFLGAIPFHQPFLDQRDDDPPRPLEG